MSVASDLETIRRILGAGETAIVTTLTPEGTLHSRPLALVDEEFDGTLWFFTLDPSPKTDEVRHHSQVNVAVSDDKGYLSLSGDASVVRDAERVDALWNPFAEAWFDGGRANEHLALLRVNVETAEYWSTDKPKIMRALELARARITKKPPGVGEGHTVGL
jgi:general stress protein 26